MKRCISIAADYAPGHDSLEAIKTGFGGAGGQIISEIRVPLDATDFSPYLQRIRDASPECTFSFSCHSARCQSLSPRPTPIAAC